jgi:hypothetical protein
MEGRPPAPARDGQIALTIRGASLGEVAAQASTHLEHAGIPVAVVGGSAVTLHAPDVYTSRDIDFAALSGTTRREFAAALTPLGFTAKGRDFVHPESSYTLDLVADTPYIDQRPIKTFAMISTRFGPVRVYQLEDAIADRIAAFLHWSDSESLDVAQRVVRARRSVLRWPALQRALNQLDASGAEAGRRLTFAVNQLRKAYAEKG